jgi:hypothetical protein
MEKYIQQIDLVWNNERFFFEYPVELVVCHQFGSEKLQTVLIWYTQYVSLLWKDT